MISLLRSLLATIEGRQDSALSSVELEQVLEVARHHRLSPLLSQAGLAGAPPALSEALRRDRLIATGRNLLLDQVAEQCVVALRSAGVPAVLLKGVAYNATIYSDAGVRPTSDVDLLVPEAARRTAFATLDRMGFEPRAAAPGFDEADYHEVAWTRKGVEVDLHLALAPLARCRIDYQQVWAKVRDCRVGKTTAACLDPKHAAVFHALHMAIDHFDVPAIYLVDLRRLLPTADDIAEADAIARSWAVSRSFTTAAALAAAFLPTWPAQLASAPFANRIVRSYGGLEHVPRREQLRRKFAHFDTGGAALRYLAVQGRRNVRELYERHVRRKSARQRLALER